ncbi:MAG: sulfatase [bacterium]
MSSTPNILFLMADQHRWDAMGCAGNPKIQTPHLDRLAASGVRFSNACTSTPICAAARHSLITGHRNSRTHWIDNQKLPGPAPEWPTIMSLLHEQGYRTHAVGNLFFHGRHYGLQSIESLEGATLQTRIDDDYLMHLKAQGIRTRCPRGLRSLLYYQPQTSGMPEAHSPSTWITNRSVAFLRDHVRYRGEWPFFLWTSWLAPQPPFAPCEPYDAMYGPDDMDLPIYPDRPLSTLASGAWSHRARLDGAHLDPPRIRRIRALYYGMISQVDDGVGCLLDELDRLGLADNTIVIYCSDHGEMLGDHGLSQKCVPYEASVRVPLLLRWPAQTEPGRVCEDLVGLTDLMPTLCAGLGLEYPCEHEQPPGESLLGRAGGGLASERDVYCIDFGHERTRWLALRTQDHQYVRWAAGGREELYDLRADPHECDNLAESNAELTADFRARAMAWEAQYGFPEAGEMPTHPEPRAPEEPLPNRMMGEAPWPDNLPEDEAGTIESYAEAFTRAIAKETCLSPDKLSLRQFKQAGGDLTGTPWEAAWREIDVAEEVDAAPINR